jgi:hypothetical protein
MSNFLLQNWGELLVGLLAFVKVIVNLTPTEKDNKVFAKLDGLVDLLVRDRIK